MGMVILATAAALLGLPLIGILMGLVQLGWHRWRKTPPDDIPFFPILVARGVLLAFAVVAVITIAVHVANPPR